ncbi:hypothetical protein ACQ4PT_034085 [Festuca glaucescens]
MSSPAISSKVVSGDPIRGCQSEEAHVLDLIAGRWAVKYTTLLEKKCKSIYSGNVLLHSDRRRLVLLDEEGITVDAKIVSTDVCISMGMSVEFPCHLVNVGEQISLLSDYDQSSPEVLRSIQPSPHEYRSEDALLIWKVSYSTRKDLDHGRMKSYDGTLKFWSSNGWIVLINAKDEPIAVQVLRVEPCYKSGSKVSFPHHVVRIDSVLVSGVMDCHMDHQKGPVDILADKPGMKVSSAAEVLDDAPDSPTVVASEPQREFDHWQHDSDQQWTLVSPSRRRVKMGMNALNLPAPKPALKHTAPVNKKLVFAEEIHYEAKKGYAAEASSSADLHLYETVSTPVISFGTTMPIQQGKMAEEEATPIVTTTNSVNPSGRTEQIEVDDDPFHQMVDDMVFQVWKCQRCLSMNHITKDCVNKVRCRGCFNYGHIKRNCLSAKAFSGKCWVPKKARGGELGSDTITAIGPTEEFAGSSSKTGETALNSSDALANKQSPHRSPPPFSSVAPSPPMANFEVDPLPWLPWGHQIIDGGPTRLPRTFYYAAQDPPAQHQSFCIAIVDPPPPPQGEEFWREQVHTFLVGPLQRHVISIQPSLFGIGMYEISSPNSVNALVQHGQYQIQNRSLRFLHVGEAPQNHRATLGFRRGWLMFLGVHPDYRNNLDIANAVSTFGQYHTWNSNDPVKDRVLVYASFPSPQLVPRDVVFGKFATVGGVKESWTAPVYILSADFAEVLPADEDPMPLDGNPHPFPGELMPNQNLFVNPQYPEIGWDAVQNFPDNEAAQGNGN